MENKPIDQAMFCIFGKDLGKKRLKWIIDHLYISPLARAVELYLQGYQSNTSVNPYTGCEPQDWNYFWSSGYNDAQSDKTITCPICLKIVEEIDLKINMDDQLFHRKCFNEGSWMGTFTSGLDFGTSGVTAWHQSPSKII